MTELTNSIRPILKAANLTLLTIDLGYSKEHAFIIAKATDSILTVPSRFEVLNVNFEERLVHLYYILTEEEKGSEEIENYCHALNSDAL